MPFVSIATNKLIKREDSDQICIEFTNAIASWLDKSPNVIQVIFNSNVSMSFANNSHDPTVFMTLYSRSIATEMCKDLSDKICSWLKEKLDVSPERIYINFPVADAKRWGFNHTTIE